ncbi:hypothetical protein POM88_023207 [Heracleum sosnowskyi]|uniref:F-box domain-containing protein n=1 Tax=Heracleum sosnowskyi TaxID=360622 RepID=A0AAD8MUP5_9APIA|nr:hypothetical protein POM88_023207 [Heracleum sosnowskyi]
MGKKKVKIGAECYSDRISRLPDELIHKILSFLDAKVVAPKLHTFTSVGIFSISFGVPELENVNLKLQGWFEYMRCEYKDKFYLRFAQMLLGLGNAKNVSFDLRSIEALSAISHFLASFPSPFYNLKRVKLPRGYKVSSMSSALRSYILGGSPRATIVTTLSQNRR